MNVLLVVGASVEEIKPICGCGGTACRGEARWSNNDTDGAFPRAGEHIDGLVVWQGFNRAQVTGVVHRVIWSGSRTIHIEVIGSIKHASTTL